MDFYTIKERMPKKGVIEIYPDFKVRRTKDLMVRGKSFYAVWDEEAGMWSTDEFLVQRIVDKDLMERKDRIQTEALEIHVKSLGDFTSNSWSMFNKYLTQLPDNSHLLDTKLTFANTVVKKSDYVSKRLPYSLEKGDHSAWDELIGTLYDKDERAKLEWAIGSIVAGDSKNIQKFIVLYGEAGTGKSTVLNIIQKLFDGYYTTFDAKKLGSSNNTFATEAFRTNPLVAIQHDGDLSKIEDNTKLNSIISHEEMTMNEKYKSSYTARANCFLFLGTNQPVKITDAKSGILRRLIDVKPTGNKIPVDRYFNLMSKIDFELGAIAQHCLDVYRKMGPHYYDGYKPVDMMLKTNVFYNFVESYYPIFKEQDGVSLKAAYEMYKEYCEDALINYKMPRYIFREELKNYFKYFHDTCRVDGKQVRSYYGEFLSSKFERQTEEVKEVHPCSLVLDEEESIFDQEFADCPAQYANEKETPSRKWDDVTSKLSDIDTKKVHYVKPPENFIVIDFDLKDDDGNKSMERNLEAASKWPATYAEFSKGGAGVHLHYFYDGDVSQLSRIFDEDIEVKVFTGKSSLRRKLTKCNHIPIAKINSGLPLKGAKKMLDFKAVKNEKMLRGLLMKCLAKEHHGATKPEVDFIYRILTDAYNAGIDYDVRDMRPKILAFAGSSTHQSQYCVELVARMPFLGKTFEAKELKAKDPDKSDKPIVFFDVEVFPNLFIVVWKFAGKDCVKMINPKPSDIEELLQYRLIGFNNRRYDNHILYARLIGKSNEELYDISQRIVKENGRNAMFSNAYNLSYTDVYDFASAGNKMSLKKWEIKLGIHHLELGLPWDQPVPQELWPKVADYCVNDVISTEAVFNHLKADWTARQILAELSGLTVNDTTNSHTTKLIVGNDRNPQSKFVYTDLSTIFPGYKYEYGKSTYRGETTGEGGYVYAEPGMYSNVALLDIASMHPTSIEQLNLFGDEYTKNFSAIKQARIYIKHKEYDKAKELFGGRLAPYLEDESTAKDLANALKTAINSVYGLTSAKFDNKLRDPRNKDNIVAKRGALFMIDLKRAVQEKGFTVAHIKTDSIKIPDATPEIIEFVMEYGKRYGYIFEHEATYEKMCLVNDAVYIAKYDNGKWTATGTQFQVPYVFKTLFSKEPIVFKDLCETKTVTTALYLDMNENLPEGEHSYHFVGRAGQFCPIKAGCGGGLLMREKDGKYSAATGTKGYRWLESEMVEELGKEKDIDLSYYNALVDAAVADISKYGDFEQFAA